jgi:hypothetical protein
MYRATVSQGHDGQEQMDLLTDAMTEILAQTRGIYGSQDPVVTLSTTGDKYWPEWDRYLNINGQQVAHVGNVCGTCNFFFQLKANPIRGLDIARLTSALETGLDGVGHPSVSAISQLLAIGEYEVLLLKVAPQRVSPRDPTDYFTRFGFRDELPNNESDEWSDEKAYYRLTDRWQVPMGKDQWGNPSLGFDFVIPLDEALDEATIQKYVTVLDKGQFPTAVSLSILDIFQPYDGDEHWCMAHYLLDGHHKVEAAARTGKPLTLLAFVPQKAGLSATEHIDKLVASYG